MPWWGWVIVGAAAFIAFWYTVVMVMVLSIFKDTKKEFKSNRKGW